MIKKFTQIILIPLLFSLQGCDSKKEGGAVEGINGEPIVLIGEWLRNVRAFWGLHLESIQPAQKHDHTSIGGFTFKLAMNMEKA